MSASISSLYHTAIEDTRITIVVQTEISETRIPLSFVLSLSSFNLSDHDRAEHMHCVCASEIVIVLMPETSGVTQ